MTRTTQRKPVSEAEIVVVIPVLGRPHRAQPLIDSLHRSDPQRLTRPVFVCSPGDDDQAQACYRTRADVIVADWPPGRADWARKCELARRQTSEPFLLLAADDVDFQPGWVEHVLALFARYDVGVVGTNDLANPTVVAGHHSTHPVVCRGYADHHGTADRPDLMLPDCYWHNWVDAELVATAQARGCWAFAPDAHVKHSNPIWGTAALDDTYRRGREQYAQDAELFRARRHLWQRAAA